MLLDRNRGRVTGWVSYTLGNSERELFGRTVPFDFDRRHATAADARTDVRVTVSITKWLEAYGEVLNLFNRSNFRARGNFGQEPGFPAGYDAEPSFPRLPTYGVRVRF